MTPIAVRMVSAETMVGEGASFSWIRRRVCARRLWSVVDSKQESESERAMYEKCIGREEENRAPKGPLK
jgi:hypothetical protein